jgi:opacity protein-like surface antigen
MKIIVCIVVGALAFISPVSSASTPSVDATAAPGYITLLVGRGMYGKMTGGELDPQVLTADQVAERLQRRGLWAAGNVIVTRTEETTRTVLGGNAYASWADWRRLAETYRWRVVNAGTYELGTDPATIRSQTCGTLPVFYDHGFTRPWGIYAYPGGQYNAAAAPIINSCFAYARTYGSEINTGPDIPEPYSIRAMSLDGGNCNVEGRACSAVFKRDYDSPASITAMLSPGPNQWGLVQMYHLVTGSRQPSGTAPAWDCTNRDWRLHWANKAEYYCARDFFKAVKRAAKNWPDNVRAATPAQVAKKWGRGNPN